MTDLPIEETGKNAGRAAPVEAMAGDLAVVVGGALLLTALIVLGESVFLQTMPPLLRGFVSGPRLLLGFAYVLFIPGYSLTAALFPAAEALDSSERIGLSMGLSIAWVPVLALVLDWLPWELHLWPILLGEIASILLFMAIALGRRLRLPVGEVYVPSCDWHPRTWWPDLSVTEKRIYKLSAVALLIAALSAAWSFLVPSPDEFMTEFYILGKEGLAEAYPREGLRGEALWVTVGISNLEREATRYRVEVWAVDPWEERREQVGEAGPFTLEKEGQVEERLTWTMPWTGDDQMVEFYLFAGAQEDQAEPYRQLRLWLNVVDGDW